MKEYPDNYKLIDGIWSLAQFIVFLYAIYQHDYFWLAASFVMNTNKRTVVNYTG